MRDCFGPFLDPFLDLRATASGLRPPASDGRIYLPLQLGVDPPSAGHMISYSESVSDATTADADGGSPDVGSSDLGSPPASPRGEDVLVAGPPEPPGSPMRVKGGRDPKALPSSSHGAVGSGQMFDFHDREFLARVKELCTLLGWCEFFVRNGRCSYGKGCRYEHPEAFELRMNAAGYPIRMLQTPCAYYMWTGACKFGTTCRFSHPARDEPEPTPESVLAWMAAMGAKGGGGDLGVGEAS